MAFFIYSKLLHVHTIHYRNRHAVQQKCVEKPIHVSKLDSWQVACQAF